MLFSYILTFLDTQNDCSQLLEKEGKFSNNIDYSLSDRSLSQLSFGAFLKALALKVKELWPFEDGQNFVFFSNFQKIISQTLS